MLVGDWNAKVVSDNHGWELVIKRSGYGERNDRGEKLLEFASKQEVLVCNTQFQQPESRKWTWRSPDGRHTNMIDSVLIEKRWQSSVKLCRTFHGADISSDHSLVLCNLQLKLKCTQKKSYEKRLNLNVLEESETKLKYEREIASRIEQNRTDCMNVENRVNKLNEVMKEAAKAVCPVTEMSRKKWISVTTLELAKEKREVRLKMKESNEMVDKY